MATTFDLVAHYEPRADFALSPGVRRSLDDLARRYTRATFMTGRHSGKPEMHTDIRGISVGTRIEVSRLVFRRSAQKRVLANTFRLFIEAAERGVASGPIRRLLINFHKPHERPQERLAAHQAFGEVFGGDCCFLTTPHEHLELGQVVPHQSLIEHMLETGPYHSNHQSRVEAVENELSRQPGRYENHRFFVEPTRAATDDGIPVVRFCYTGPKPDNLVEVAMRQKTEERLVFVPREQAEGEPQRYVSLGDYDRAARRYGTLWVLQGDLVRPLERSEAAAMYLFFSDDDQPEYEKRFTWQQLYDRMQQCRHINRACRHSPTYLDLSLDKLVRKDFLETDKQTYWLTPHFDSYVHVTFYELGTYERRLSGN